MSGLNLLVFREGRQHANGQQLKAALVGRLQQSDGGYSYDALLGALLLAGELECGLADLDIEAAQPVEPLTDSIVAALLDKSAVDLKKLIATAQIIPVFDKLNISTPEGFAYYALHPLAYADIEKISVPAKSLMVVGIRSIGTTLSAVTTAAARRSGIQASRITVRPQGHPYNRAMEFLPKQLAAIQQAIAADARFAIVDEGPGLSGSSFLSVAEALERTGVLRENITLVSSHAPNADGLCSDNAESRWKRYRNVAVAGEARRPNEAQVFIGGGGWRTRLFANRAEWPATWISFERLKYLTAGDPAELRLYKFAGFGHYGDRVFEREQAVAAAGFGPLPRREADGFVSYPWMYGRAMSSRDLSKQVLERLAHYCAFRLREFPAELSNLGPLQQMAEHNLRELGCDASVNLRLERPVIADGRMQPHEWLMMKEGRMLKADSGSHGDDHFFPGPTDIAWDLAGAIIEWEMSELQAKEFLTLYRSASGDDASARIDDFIKAYAIFRWAYCLMAANSMNGSDEQIRFERAADSYRARLTKMDSCSMVSA
ncbi:MAG TPA: hypothetical protein VGJ33_06220 [Candidatus Angelobacter sp.]|jgi:hypothetical protein